MSPKERYLFGAASLIFVVSSLLWSVTTFYAKTVPEAVEGGSYVEGIVGQPIAVNPLIAGDNDPDRDLIALLFASLFDLTDTHTADETQKVWTINLKENLKWSDGEPLTSDDVIFTISTIQDPEARSPIFATWQGVLAERLSERELRLTLKNSYAFFLDNIKNLRVAPQHIFDNIPPQNFRLSDFNLKPVGSGPYKFVSFDKHSDGFISEYAMASNKYYALKKPFITNLKIKFFPNRLEAIDAFNIKSVDGLGGLDQDDIGNIKISYKTLNVDRPRYYAIFFNQGVNPALKEKDVRLALSMAVDKQRILNEALDGQGVIVNGPIPPTVAGYDAQIYANETFSTEKAAEILEKAGWKVGDDGIRSKVIGKNKLKLEFEMAVPEAKFLIESANSIRDDWKKIGVNLNPVTMRAADIVSSAIKPRNYQLILFGNTLNNNPDVFSFWHSSQRFDPGLNLSIFSDKTADTLLESIRQNLDENSRLQDLSKLQKIINDSRPAVFLYSPRYLYVTSKNLGGFSAASIAFPANRFEKVSDWYLKTARVFK